jgi:VWFA-related protein
VRSDRALGSEPDNTAHHMYARPLFWRADFRFTGSVLRWANMRTIYGLIAVSLGLFNLVLISQAGAATDASGSVFRADVQEVVLTFTVTDANGKFVSGLRPGQVSVTEDGIEQRLRTFSEKPATDSRPMGGIFQNVFILFDTSNCMYGNFAPAQDEIARFVRSLEPDSAVAIYSFSRNLYRAVPLTRDLQSALRGLREVVAGDDTALYNAILLALRDAGKVPGRKTLVVFSNGPDNWSAVSPGDVAAVAEEYGVPVYVISTRQDRVTNQVLASFTEATGGKTYIALTQARQDEAFGEIQMEMKHTYLVTYSPEPNTNRGFRRIQVRVGGGSGYRVRARAGYEPPRGRE